LSAQQPVFRAGVKLIETTVVVHRKGQPVADLTAADFKIFEDGKEQKIEFFAMQGDVSRDRSVQSFPLPKNVFSNRPEQRAGGGVTVLLLDRLNSNAEDLARAKEQVVKLLANANPGDRIALYVLEGDTITVLHDFTSDTRRLTAILARHLSRNTNVRVAALEDTAQFARQGDASPGEPHAETAGSDADTEAWLERGNLILAEALLAQRGRLTLDALEGIANHLEGIAGRKNLIWISAAFPVVIPAYKGAPIVLDKELNRAARAINSADVAIYPVDVRGLMGAFTNVTTSNATTDPKNPRGVAQPPAGFNQISLVQNNQDAMRTLADATGGRVFLNSNALGESVEKAMNDARLSYVLGYYAPRSVPDNKQHHIDVKVARDGVDVRHRKGYFSVPPPKYSDAKARLDAMNRIMQSPVPASGLALMAQLDRDSDMQATLVVQINPESLTWIQKGDIREGAVDIVIAQSEPDGKYYKIKETTANLTADPERYQQMLTDGFTLSSRVNLRPAAYRIHVVVSDVPSQAIGSLIIPVQNR
jgi:VWFA-related protein